MTPLTNTAAEQVIIGCCLQGEILVGHLDGLLPEHFAVEAHRIAFGAIIEAWARGVPLDSILLDEALTARGTNAAGLAYWAECAQAGYSLAVLPGHVATVREKAARRAMLAAADRIASLAHEDGDVGEQMAAAMTAVGALADGTVQRGPRLLADVLTEHLPAMGERWDGRQDGLMTGFRDLDAKLGGLRAGNLVLIAARPAMGKTSLAMQIAARVARDSAVVAFSQEMLSTELADRLLAAAGRLPLSTVIGGGLTSEEHDRFAQAVGRLRPLQLYIDDQPAQRLTDIRTKVLRIRRRQPIGLVVVDYLQLMAGDGHNAGANRNTEIEQISRGLKALAKELGCPVVALSQLSRECEKRPNKRPLLSDLRDSGAIEQDADIVLMVYRDELYNPDSPDRGTAEILIRKHRQGGTGMVRLTWLGEFTAFANCAYQTGHQTERTTTRRGFDD